MDIAKVYSKRGTCPKLKVGAVLIKNNRLVAAGYNGAPKNLPHCSKLTPICNELNNHCRNTLHAEESVIAFCAKNGISTKGTVLFVTQYPCNECTKLMLAVGITKIYYLNDYKNNENLFSKYLNIQKINKGDENK